MSILRLLLAHTTVRAIRSFSSGKRPTHIVGAAAYDLITGVIHALRRRPSAADRAAAESAVRVANPDRFDRFERLSDGTIYDRLTRQVSPEATANAQRFKDKIGPGPVYDRYHRYWDQNMNKHWVDLLEGHDVLG